MVTNRAAHRPMVTSVSLTHRSPSSFGRTSAPPAASTSSDRSSPPATHPSIAFGHRRLHSKPIRDHRAAEVAMSRRTTVAVVTVVLAAGVVAVVALAGAGGSGLAPEAGTGQVELVSSSVAVVPEGQRQPLPPFPGRTLDGQGV